MQETFFVCPLNMFIWKTDISKPDIYLFFNHNKIKKGLHSNCRHVSPITIPSCCLAEDLPLNVTPMLMPIFKGYACINQNIIDKKLPLSDLNYSEKKTIPGTTHFDESDHPAVFYVNNNSPPQNQTYLDDHISSRSSRQGNLGTTECDTHLAWIKGRGITLVMLHTEEGLDTRHLCIIARISHSLSFRCQTICRRPLRILSLLKLQHTAKMSVKNNYASVIQMVLVNL